MIKSSFGSFFLFSEKSLSLRYMLRVEKNRVAAIVFVLTFTFFFMLSACKKNNEVSGSLVPGNIALNVLVKHHTWGVPYTTVYLKKNATSYPGEDTSKYDISQICDNDGNASFEGLHPGNYFVFSKGYDMIWGDTVIGYSPVSIVSTALENNSVQLTLIVSE